MNETYTKPKILPPVWLLMGGLTEFVLDRWLPLAQWLETPWTLLGGISLLAGLGAILWAPGAFNKAKTGIVPFTETTALVTHGLYRFTRNPMYPVYCFAINGIFRGHLWLQCKAGLAGNGWSFSRSPTPQCSHWWPPCGPVAKRPSAVLCPLEVVWLPRRGHALRLATLRLAERAINCETVH